MNAPEVQQATAKPLVVPGIVTLPREVDISNASRIGRDLLGAFGPYVTVIIADMSLTEFCDSSGMRLLLRANDAAGAWDRELRVVVRSPAVLRVMEITGVDQVLRIYGSLGEALTGKPGFEAEAGKQAPEPADATGRPEMAQARTTANRARRTLPLGQSVRIKRGGYW